MAKKWGPGNPLYEWKRKKGLLKGKARKKTRRVVKRMAKKKGRRIFSRASKPTFPLIQFVQGMYIAQQATGGRLDDLIYQVVDALTGKPDAINLSWNRDRINEIIGYIANNPQKVVIDTAIAVAVTAGVRKILAAMGVPATVDLGMCYIRVR